MTFPVPTPSTGLTVSESMGDAWGNGINYLQTVLEGPSTAWTPAFTATTTNPTTGTGTGSGTKGWWKRVGEWVDASFYLGFGTAGVAAGSGFYQMNLPAAMAETDFPLGYCYLFDFSAATQPYSPAVVVPVSTTAVRFGYGGGYITNAVPWTWAIGDKITGHLRYRAA